MEISLETKTPAISYRQLGSNAADEPPLRVPIQQPDSFEAPESWRSRSIRLLTGGVSCAGIFTCINFHNVLPLLTWPLASGLYITTLSVPLMRLNSCKKITRVVVAHSVAMLMTLGAAIIHVTREQHTDDDSNTPVIIELCLPMLGIVGGTAIVLWGKKDIRPACTDGTMR